jgi:hypothetical protein
MDLQETGWKGVEWIHVALDMELWLTLPKSVMNF